MKKFLSDDQAEGIRFVLEEVYGAQKQQSKQFIKNCEKLFT